MLDQKDNATAHKALEYDEQIQKTIPFYPEFHNQTIQLVKACKPSPDLWLDTGCGTGMLVRKSIDVFCQTKFLLCDPSVAMLQVAKEALSGYPDRIAFLEPASTQELHFNRGIKPDVITAIQAHHYLSASDREKATTNCFDLLKTDGLYITFENVSPVTNAGIEIGKRNWGNFQLSKGKTEEQVENHLSRFGVDYFPIPVEEHLALYRRCGFKTVEIFWYSYMQAGFFCIK
jgi:tRNA (cmo5U34)-methyltransferase